MLYAVFAFKKKRRNRVCTEERNKKARVDGNKNADSRIEAKKNQQKSEIVVSEHRHTDLVDTRRNGTRKRNA